MPKLSQNSFAGGEVSPSLFSRADLQRYTNSLRTCRNFFVRATGGVSNRAGTQFIYALDPTSLATLIPFVFSINISYMLVFQQESIKVYSGGAFVQTAAAPVNIAGFAIPVVPPYGPVTIDTVSAHGLSAAQTCFIDGTDGTGSWALNGPHTVEAVLSATRFTIPRIATPVTGDLPVSLGTVAAAVQLTTDYQSDDLADLRYIQSADILTVMNQSYVPSQLIRSGPNSFTFGAITDFSGGPFLDDNETDTEVTASAATGTGITLTSTTPIFTASHVGTFFRLKMEDLSAIPPWEPNKLLAASGVDPTSPALMRRSDGKVYILTAPAGAAPAGGVYTGTVPPIHDKGTEADGDGSVLAGVANSKAGVSWQYLHSEFGIAKITAVGGGNTATADVMDYLPVVSPATTTIWAFGAWSTDQGYPAVATYYQDRLVFANTPQRPYTEWASKTGDYHKFSVSSPLAADDAITQTLNARQINAIVELIPMDQLISLTSSSSWASPHRGETWSPLTIGFDPQAFDGAEFLRAVMTGDSAIFAQRGGTKLRDIAYGLQQDKFTGNELTVLARHLFGPGKTIVDMDYAKEPFGILWIVRSDGALIGLTYLKEQDVIGWHRHDTQGFFERVCVIPEGGVDVPYFVVRRTINGSTVRYLERMAVRDQDDIRDSFFVDCGLTYDGRNTTETTVRIFGSSYDGGQIVSLVASSAIFAGASDVGDAIQFPSADGSVRASITEYLTPTTANALLQSPVPASLQGVPTTEWVFARDTFSGLGHLEGATVAILADGAPEVQQTVASGTITLAYPAGVVHIGLPYTCDIETLDVVIFGASESIRDNAKTIPKVSIVVEQTLGLKAGPDADNLYDIGTQPVDFNENTPWDLQDGVETGYLINTWNKSGHVFLRQDYPLPATILQILPTVEVGSNG